MAAGYGFVHYPQQPGPTAAQMGSLAEHQAMLAAAQAALHRPGFLPYGPAKLGLGAALQPALVAAEAPGEPDADDAAPPAMGADAVPTPAGIGAALLRAPSVRRGQGVPRG